MKPSNSDLEDLWQAIAFAFEQRGRRIPRWLCSARRAYQALLLSVLRRLP